MLTAIGAGADGVFRPSIAVGLQMGVKARVKAIPFVNGLKSGLECFP